MASNVENASHPVDNKRLNSRNFDQYFGDDFNSKQGNLYTNHDRECGGEYNRNPWGTSENKESGYLGDGTLHMEENAEISSLRQQLEQLSKEEALLKKRTEADDLRRLVAEKKRSVAALKDASTRSGNSMEDDLNSTEENVPSHHNDTSRSKTPLVQNISEFTITARISQTTIIQKSEKTGKPYAVFSIRVWKKRNGEEEICDVYRRYSDFHDLQMSIAEKIPEFHGPNLPPKTVLNNMSEEFLVKRSKALDGYLQTLLNRELWDQYPGLEDHVLKFLAPVLWEKQISDLARDDTRIGAKMRKPETKIPVHNHTYKKQHVHTADSNKSNRTSSSTSSNRRQPPGYSCEDCAISFSIFKRKKPCKDCGRNFCSQCVTQPSRRPFFASSKDYQCRCCQILLTGTFSRSQLLKWKIKDLKAPLTKQNINTSTCKEKTDLIDLLFVYYGNTSNLYMRDTEHETKVQQMVVSTSVKHCLKGDTEHETKMQQMVMRMREEQFNTTHRQPPTVPRYPSATHQTDETYSSCAGSENMQQDMTYSSGADSENMQQDETNSLVADSEDTHQDDIHSSGANSESRQKAQTYSSSADCENRQQDKTYSSVADSENRQQDDTHSSCADSKDTHQDEIHISAANSESRQKDQTYSSSADSENILPNETRSSGANSEGRQLDETQSSVADSENRQQEEKHSSGADSESRQQDETQSSVADNVNRQQNETHSSVADSGNSQRDNTHSSIPSSANTQQKEAHNSCADDENMQENEEDSYDDQNLVDVDEYTSMGAGIVKPEPNGGIRIHIHTGGSQHVHTAENHTANSTSSSTSSNRRQSPTSNCEDCATSFSTFKRKKSCKDCGRDFCSQCVLQPSRRPSSDSSRDYQCKSCQILLTGTFSRSQLLKWKIKDLKALLTKQNINTSKCKEKSDLIDLLFTNYGNTPNLYRRGTEQEILVQQMTERMRQEQSNTTPRQPPKVPRNPSTPQPASETQSSGAAGETQSSGADSQSRQQDEAQSSGADNENRLENDEETNNNQDSEGADERKVSQDSQPLNARIQLDDVKSEEEIDSLDIKSLKRLLLNNFVDYKGCKEKWELQERLRRLWRDNQANKKLYEEQTATSEASSSTTAQAGSREEDICKICMDSAIDCVLLECGHMVSCTKCGKQLSECPICRQYVVRAVHTFRT